MNIRIAQKKDTPALVEFNQAMALETEGKRLDSGVLKSGVEAVFDDDKKGFYIVAEEDAEIIGGLLITFEWSDWRNGDFWWIQSVYVRPSHRGRGHYRRLHEHVRGLAAREPDVCGLRLYVERENAGAQATYRALGMYETPYLLFEESTRS